MNAIIPEHITAKLSSALSHRWNCISVGAFCCSRRRHTEYAETNDVSKNHNVNIFHYANGMKISQLTICTSPVPPQTF